MTNDGTWCRDALGVLASGMPATRNPVRRRRPRRLNPGLGRQFTAAENNPQRQFAAAFRPTMNRLGKNIFVARIAVWHLAAA
jgi:hypothetical protein